jgi:hypothetical protein
MLKITMLAMATFIVLQMPAFSDSVYVWTDEKGVKHYSNSGPSERIEDYQKEKELPQDRASAPATREVSSDAPSPAESRTGSPPTVPPKEEGNTDPDAEFLDATRLNLDNFPQQQGDLVQREKSIVGNLQQELEQPGVERANVIERERKRLIYAINALEQAPLEKFGSQKNKRRQVGYYKYRLDELQNNPDAYFQYPQLDTD